MSATTVEKEVWSRTQQALKTFVYRRVKDKALTDDIVQDVFLKVHTRLHQVKDFEKITGWIYQITRNAITDHFRAQSKSINAFDLDWESEHSSLNDCVASCLKEMLLTLPAKYREALELTELKNFSQTQLAEKLNISYSGAKSRVQRARQMLKSKMDAHYEIKMDAYGNVIVCENRVPCNCNQDLLYTS
jgi:RNA polymerase sigma-70 factor (ECF subfamily)